MATADSSAPATNAPTWESDKWVAALLSFLTRLADSASGRKAQEYATPAMVRKGHYDPELHMVSALVQGNNSQPYRTELSLQAKTLRAYCSCPVGYECKHTYAVAMLLAAELRSREVAGAEQLEDFLPYNSWDEEDDTFRPGTFLALPELPTPPASKAVADAEAIAEPAQPTSPWWRRLLATDKPRAIQKLLEEGMQQRVIDRHGHTSWMTNMLARDLATLKHPLQMLQQFDEALERSARLYRYKVKPREPNLEAFLRSGEAEELSRETEIKKAEDRLLDWLQTAPTFINASNGHTSLHVQWDTRRGDGGIHRLVGQVIVNNGGNRGTRTRKLNGLWQLSNDVHNGLRTYGPAGDKLLKWVVALPQMDSRYDSSWANAEDDGTLLYIDDVYAWASNPTYANLVVWPDKSPVQLHHHPASLSLGRDESGKPQWVVSLGNAQNAESELPLSECELIAETVPDGFRPDGRVYLRQGSTLRPLDIGTMPLDVLSSIRTLPSVPVKRIKREGVGARLLHSIQSTAVTTRISRWMREVPCRPVVEVRLTSEDRIVVTAHAQHGDSGLFDYDFSGHWLPRAKNTNDGNDESLEPLQSAPTDGATAGENGHSNRADAEPTAEVVDQPSESEALATQPRRVDVSDLELWLPQFIAPNATHVLDPDPTAVWTLNPKQLPDLLRAWATRPGGVEYRGNPAFRQLVTFRRAPRFSVQIEKSEVEWLKVSVSLEEEMEMLSVAEVDTALSTSTDSLVLLSGGRAYDRADLEAFLEQAQSLEALGLSTTGGKQRLHAMQIAGAQPDALTALSNAGAGLKALGAEARKVVEEFSGIPSAPVAPVPSDFLRPYQRAGVDFLAWSAQTFGGGILADDMGLGKTLQVLATITALKASQQSSKPPLSEKKDASGNRTGGHMPCLVVCPASVAHNWQREAQRFTPDLRVLVLESGAGRKSHLQSLAAYDLIIVNYALLRRDAEALAEQDWLIIVADEAQAIKNPQAEVTRVIKDLDSRYRIALTGTPIENRLSDLWSISDFALPGYLGQMDKAAVTSTDPATTIRMHRLLRARLRPVLMRRLKAEVAPELPERIETRIECEMLPAQRKLYLAELKRTRSMLETLPGDQLKGQGRIQMLAALTRLRQICCDPVLVKSDAASGKTEELLELVSNLLAAGHKVLLFSQFVRMLTHLELQLKEKGIRTYTLTGATTKRQELVDKFENDGEPSAFLISLKAGGTGLNLTSASHVVLFDPWWNPAVEAQAIDRAHRIGQDKTVVAYRLISSGTIEERIVELQETKRALVRNVLEEDAFNRTLQRNDFQYLLGE